MAKGWMSKDPSEMTARQQRRMQFLEKRGRGGRVQGQPTEMPEMTARQQRRQQFLERKQARQDRRVEDYRAQQQQQPLNIQFGQGVSAGIGGYFAPIDPGYVMTEDQAAKIGLYRPGGNPMDYANAVSGGFEAERQPIQYQPARDAIMNRIDPNMRQAMMQPERQMNYAQVNAMPNQLRTGTFTPQGMYRPLPFYATPQQVEDRRQTIQSGTYFNR